jgi:hypothetical protein
MPVKSSDVRNAYKLSEIKGVLEIARLKSLLKNQKSTNTNSVDIKA